jgi:protein-disulfide isomerase
MTLSARIALAAGSLLLAAACGGAQSQDKPKAETAAPASAALKGPAAPAATDMVLGSADAPITLIEYASVTCPACAAWHTEILPEMQEKYIDTGKVRLVFREFPTPPVPMSYIGSLLGRCAAEKTSTDAYFLVIGALMKTQRDWVQGEDPKAELMKIAAQAGMDQEAFDACLKRQDLVDLISDNVDAGAETFKITRTPSFVINGELANVRSIEEFDAAFAPLLAASAAQ